MPLSIVYMYLGVIILLIHRMTATFGKLQSRTLDLKDGLNIIEAPNETGKSTWCAFLLAMLYGINSRERDRAGFIAEKNRYAPWSGLSMSGRLDCRAGTDELSLLRATRRQSTPMGDFQALYTGTGDNVPHLTGQNCGETLLGVSREVYERSAFIRQSGMTVTQEAGLERRIAALITSGEEDTSYTEAMAALKKQLNRRRHNKTGQLPALENALQEVRQQLSEWEALSARFQDVRRQEDALTQKEAALAEELALHDRWDAAQERRALREAEAAAIQAEQAAEELRRRIAEDRVPENETIGRLRGALVNLETTRKAVDKARASRDEAAKALLRAQAAASESPFTGLAPEQAEKSPLPLEAKPRLPLWATVSLVGCALCAAALAVLFGIGMHRMFRMLSLPVGAACVLLGIAALLAALSTNRKRTQWEARAEELRRQREKDLAAYARLYQAVEDARAEAEQRSAAAEALYSTLSSNEQAILLEIRRFTPAAFDSATADALLRRCAIRRQELTRAEAAAREARMRWELLAQKAPSDDADDAPPTPPARSREETAAQLHAVRGELASLRSTADRLTGQLHAVGDPASLRSEDAGLTEQIALLTQEYDALRLAMDALEHANTTLQNRFSPELGRRTAEIFSALTGGKYSGVVLDRAFNLSAEPTGDTVYRPSALLSAGTADQLYLAVRLAICELVLPEETCAPIVLDDALASFDDDRCAAALRWLKDEGKRRQILLFTCHSRESAFFAGDGEVSVQRLTEA